MQFLWTSQVSSSIYHDALAIRKNVFIDEQSVPIDLEIDDLESSCYHVVAYDNEQPVATARIYPKTNTIAKIQRVAVLAMCRGQKIGQNIMQETERYAKSLGFTEVTLGAQNHAISFYEKLGYHVVGKEYEDAGISHHDMEKSLC